MALVKTMGDEEESLSSSKENWLHICARRCLALDWTVGYKMEIGIYFIKIQIKYFDFTLHPDPSFISFSQNHNHQNQGKNAYNPNQNIGGQFSAWSRCSATWCGYAWSSQSWNGWCIRRRRISAFPNSAVPPSCLYSCHAISTTWPSSIFAFKIISTLKSPDVVSNTCPIIRTDLK